MDWVSSLYMPLLTDLTGNFQVAYMFKVHLHTYIFPFSIFSNNKSKMSLLALIQQNGLTSSNTKELAMIMLLYKKYWSSIGGSTPK